MLPTVPLTLEILRFFVRPRPQNRSGNRIVAIAVLLFRSGLVLVERSVFGGRAPFSSSPNRFLSFSGLTVGRRVNATLSGASSLA